LTGGTARKRAFAHPTDGGDMLASGDYNGLT
jgi:hypothetical protein